MVDAEPGHWPESLSIRCRRSACRIESDGREMATLHQLLESAREQQAHVSVRLHDDEGSPRIEAYVGRDRAPPESE